MLAKIFGGGSTKKNTDEEERKQLEALGVDASVFDSDEGGNTAEEVDWASVHAIANEDVMHVDFTDADMNDPKLLADLRAIGGDEELPSPASSTSTEEIQQRILEEKRNAIECKRKGDMEGAKQALLTSKALQTQLDQLLSKNSQPPLDVQQYEIRTPPEQSLSQAKQSPTVLQESAMEESTDGAHMDIQSDDTAEIEKRILIYKRAALAAKKSGAKQQALVFMKDINVLQNALENAQVGIRVDLGTLPPPEPVHTLATSPTSTDRAFPSINATPASPSLATAQHQRIQTLHVLHEELTRAEQSYKSAALKAKHDNDLPAAKTALYLTKETRSQLAYVEAALEDATVPIPAHHYETRTHTQEVAFSDLAEHEMEITVVSVISVRPPQGYTTLSTYVACEVQYPSIDSPQKFQTPAVADTLSPQFNYTAKVFIDRKKSFQRFLEKKKQIIFTLYHSRFLLSNIVIAKAELVLPELNDKAEVIKKLPLMKDGARRQPHGGEVEVRVRIKTPLAKKDIRTITEKILVIDGPLAPIPAKLATDTAHPSQENDPSSKVVPMQPQQKPVAKQQAVSSPQLLPSSHPTVQQAPPQLSPQVTPPPKPVTQNPQAAKQQPALQPPPQQPSPQQTLSQNPSTPVEDISIDLEDVNNVDNITSNDVLEYELETVNSQLASFVAKKATPPDHLVDRKQALELKMNLLVIQVQTGRLSQEDYMELLKKKIEEENNLAKKLVSLGKKDWARFPLTRAKIMKKEMESANEGGDE